MNIRIKRISIVAAVAATAALGAAIAVASIPAPDGTIHGCRNTVTGVLRVIDSSSSCGPLQASLNWAQQGPVGPRGDVGPQGAVGPKGDPGGSSPQSTIVYSHHVTTSDYVYVIPCPAGYYLSSWSSQPDDGNSGTGAVEAFSPNLGPIYPWYGVSLPFTVYSACSYYGAVITQ